MFNPYAILIAGLVFVVGVSGSFMWGMSTGKEVGAAKCLRQIDELNKQITDANEAIRQEGAARRARFAIIAEERRRNVEEQAAAKDAAKVEFQTREVEYEAELERERTAFEEQLAELDPKFAEAAKKNSCLVTRRDLERMRRGDAPLD